jgi:hypothetical protein
MVRLFSNYQGGIMVALYALLISTGSVLLLTIPPVIGPLSFLEPVGARFGGFLLWLFLASLLLIIMLRIVGGEILRKSRIVSRLDEILMIAGMFVLVFVLYAHIAALIGWVNKTRYSYWNLLAGQFLEGKLYLEKPPYTHDLTQYGGKWYVPMPPLPAILMMPIAGWIGADKISTAIYPCSSAP